MTIFKLGPGWNSTAVYVTKLVSFTLTIDPGGCFLTDGLGCKVSDCRIVLLECELFSFDTNPDRRVDWDALPLRLRRALLMLLEPCDNGLASPEESRFPPPSDSLSRRRR